ncbi:SDR family NAD(P)-dependent oxidoreductase [Falsibacillus albus]|uniref:SDR family NAD(P)-dependent oxidoreductase n=1 Tax=Falsibacillus albus TaxID=2478915 RepID=UPI001F22626B|nr:SDR family oxidoreductase [Falsibacillus albus]
MNNQRLHGKNVVITGASAGIGEEMAYLCAQNGANVFLLARRLDKLQSIKEKIDSDYGVHCYISSLDVSEHDQIPAVFQTVYEKMGRVDVLVNNAGFGVFDEILDADFNDISGMFNVNVLGLIACTQQVISDMCHHRSGHIINIASQAGKLATPKSSVYAASKHAVLGFTNSIRMELSRSDVYVTAVNPGPIATNFFDVADESGTYVKNVEKFMLTPHYVAGKVVSRMLTNTREINLPGWMNIGSTLYALFPRLVERIGKNAFFKK